MRRALVLLLVAGCTAELPNVDPTQLACAADELLEDGDPPCPETHWCEVPACRPRLDCDLPGVSGGGCQGDPTQPSPSRCEPVFGPHTSAVRCESGVHTLTSTAPADPVVCDCPDGTHCVALASPAVNLEYPLFVLPEGGPLPAGVLGIEGEHLDRRRCLRACSSEAACPADHTCRPAAVLNDDLLAAPDTGRHTIAVCQPNVLVPTSTVTFSGQPDPQACLQPRDCPLASEGGRLACHARADRVQDHPHVPAGPAWGGDRWALISRCIDLGRRLAAPGIGCDRGRGETCESGICYETKCAARCNPTEPEVVCGPGKACTSREVEQRLSDGRVVKDRLHICER